MIVAEKILTRVRYEHLGHCVLDDCRGHAVTPALVRQPVPVRQRIGLWCFIEQGPLVRSPPGDPHSGMRIVWQFISIMADQNWTLTSALCRVRLRSLCAAWVVNAG
jgi:hypothetical protein